MPCKRVFPEISDLALLFPVTAENYHHPRLIVLSRAPVIATTGTRRDHRPSPIGQTTKEL